MNELLKELKALDKSTLDRLKLNPSDRISQFETIITSFNKRDFNEISLINFNEVSFDKRDFNSQLDNLATAQAIAASAANYAQANKNNLYTKSVDVLGETIVAEYLAVKEANSHGVSKNRVLIAFIIPLVIGPRFHHVLVRTEVIIYLAADALSKWVYDCTWFPEKHRTLHDMLGKCVSEDDLVKHLVIDHLEIEPIDADSKTSGPTQRTTSITLPSFPQMICPNIGALSSLQLHRAVTGGFGTVADSWDTIDNKKICLFPVYYINLYGNSLRVACNAYKYMARRGNIIYSRRPLDPQYKPELLVLRMYKMCPTGNPDTDHKDEFPMNGMYEGWERANGVNVFDTSILCIPVSENTSEGGHWKNFLAGKGVWKKCDPMDQNSPDRTGPIPPATGPNQRYTFIVQAIINDGMGNSDFDTVCYRNKPDYRVPGYKNLVDETISPPVAAITMDEVDYIVRNKFSEFF